MPACPLARWPAGTLAGSFGFEQKINRTVAEVCKVIGVPSPGPRRYFEATVGAALANRPAVQHSVLTYTYLDEVREGAWSGCVVCRLRHFLESGATAGLQA